MNISVKEVESVTVVQFEGHLDTSTAPDAQARLDELVEGGTTKILVNFTDLEYISSAGLRVLLVIGKRLGSAGGKLRLCNLNETVFEVFEISGFSTIFSVFKDQAEALDSF